MTLTRRRFLTIAASCAALPRASVAQTWRGHAFGAEVSLTIRGEREAARAALEDARTLIGEVEALFSLYDPGSQLSRLNADGTLEQPPARFMELMQAADRAVGLTDGLFDPTVQPLWRALATGQDAASALARVGWDRVAFGRDRITLGAGQSLTFNGIAQGYATDLVAAAFEARGLSETLVNIGEFRGQGGPWTLGIEDPVHGQLGTRRLDRGAIATSSPAATPLADQGHILHPTAVPEWSTVSVEAPSATVADSLSTAMVLAPRDQIAAIKEASGITRVTLISFEGDLVTL